MTHENCELAHSVNPLFPRGEWYWCRTHSVYVDSERFLAHDRAEQKEKNSTVCPQYNVEFTA